MKYKLKIRYIVLCTLLLVVWATQLIPAMGKIYAHSVYPVIAYILSSFSRLIPFAIGDLFIALSIAGVLLYPAYARRFQKKKWKRILLNDIEYLLWIYVWFYLTWGLNYSQPNFYQRTKIPYTAYTPENFRNFVDDYIFLCHVSGLLLKIFDPINRFIWGLDLLSHGDLVSAVGDFPVVAGNGFHDHAGQRRVVGVRRHNLLDSGRHHGFFLIDPPFSIGDVQNHVLNVHHHRLEAGLRRQCRVLVGCQLSSFDCGRFFRVRRYPGSGNGAAFRGQGGVFVRHQITPSTMAFRTFTSGPRKPTTS